MELDLMIDNARIRTGLGERPAGSRIGIWRGRIVGIDEQLDGFAAARRVDAGGAFVMAGFNDVHAHSVWFGQTLGEIDLSNAKTAGDVYDAIRAGVDSSLAPDAWVVASSYDPLGLTGERPDRDELDRASGGRPLLIKHSSGHAYTVNGIALRLVGIPDQPDHQPEGGVIAVDESGRATGVLDENAMRIVQDVVLPDPTSEIVDALGRATAQYAREGLTSVTDAGIGGGWIGHSPREFTAYQVALERGLLATRMQPMVVADVLHELNGHSSEAGVFGLDAGIRSGLGDARLQLGPMKMFLDGSLLGATAAMTEPYCTHRHSSGYFQDDVEAMRRRAHEAAAGGWALALHAIGDRAVDLALDIIEEAQELGSQPPHMPNRIEHGGVVRPDQVARIAALDVSLVPQPLFIAKYGDGMGANLGPDRTLHSYPAASLLKAGANLPGSSDRPVAPGAPLPIIQAFVERKTQTGALYGADERISVEQALTAYTVGSARATGWAGEKGTLAPGMLADLVALSDDPRDVPVDAIGDIDVVATWVGGASTHGELPDA
ncbi:amidohydrolase [Ruicaihuangia caeni]|uniref:Amidohydrolase n=1 Tax=Ruicaihuangia caeni TaxID=3042517 RepID=A0AAW6T7I0_9MICO|nr:amidohydrolase [Klugiella sp. YN-L-19]MDI2099174.1 amidohydrolase [Klugiella sp. YN-L-19]